MDGLDIKGAVLKYTEKIDRRLYPLLFLVVAALFPIICKNMYILHILILLGVYQVLGLSLNIVTGVAGELDLGHAAFFGVGAYASSLVMQRLTGDFWTGFLAAIVLAFLFGLILGIPSLRIRGDYLAIVTLGFNEIMRYVMLNWQELTNGPLGINSIQPPGIFGLSLGSKQMMFYFISLLCLVTYVVTKRISTTRFGRSLVAIRDNEIAATSLGINTGYYKVMGFAIAAAFAGAAGSFFAHYMTFINPNNFTSNESILILCMVVIGGKGSFLGTITGVAILFLLPEVLRPVANYRMLIYGVMIILMMVYRSKGFIPEKRVPVKIGKRRSEKA